MPELMKVFEMLALTISWVKGRVAGRSLGDSDAEADLGKGGRKNGSRIPTTPDDDGDQGDDILMNAETYPGWEKDLLEQHFVLGPKLKTELRGMAKDKTYWCEKCQASLPSWVQVVAHVVGKRHRRALANDPALPAPAPKEPEVALERAIERAIETAAAWPPLLRYAHAGKLREADSELVRGVDPNATAPGDDRTPLFWAAWQGHHHVVARLLQHGRARRDALKLITDARSAETAKRWPCSALDAAHDRWGQDSATFRAFALLMAPKGR